MILIFRYSILKVGINACKRLPNCFLIPVCGTPCEGTLRLQVSGSSWLVLALPSVSSLVPALFCCLLLYAHRDTHALQQTGFISL